MWKPNTAWALSLAILAGFSGCAVKNKITAAISGASTTSSSSRTLAFVDAPSRNLGIVSTGSTTLVRVSVSTTGVGDATVTSSSNSDSNYTFNGGTFPGTGGTCTQPIQGNCSIAILFTAPATPGTYSNLLTVGYTVGNTPLAINLSLVASVSAAASLSINGGATYAFGTKNISTSTDATLTVANAGSIGASSLSFSGLSAPITYKGGSYPGTGGTCATFLAGLSSCTVVITYAPTSAASTSQTFTANYNDGSANTSSNIAITGTAVTLASVALTSPVANPYDYGSMTIGATALSNTYTFQNSGGQSATAISVTGLAAPFAYKGGSYPGTGGTCGASLAAAASCTLVIDYTATSAVTSNATLTFTYANGSGSTVSLTEGLRGTGMTPASLAISDGPTYSFGAKTIGTTTNFTFTVTNSGGSTATALSGSALAAPYAYLGGTYPGTGGTCGASLAAAGTCTVVVTYSPSAAVVSNATLTLPYNTGAAATSATRPITGTGISAASLALNGGANFSYGTVNVTSVNDTTLSISNSGASTATSIVLSGLSAPILFKGGSFPGAGGTCGTSLAGGASCTVVLTYSPTVPGATNQTLLVNYDSGASATSTSQTVSGTAIALASLSITNPVTDPFDFGNVTIGSAALDQTFTISNSGGQSATALSMSGLSAPLGYKDGSYPGTGGDCGASLALGTSCTIVVTFLPSSPGLASSTLSISYHDGNSTINLSRGIQGTGKNPASLSISNTPTYDFGSRSISSTTHFTFTITNSGGSTATGIAGTALTAPFEFKGGGAFPGTGGTCGATLGAGATCTVILSFAPTGVGGFTGTFEATYSDGVAASSASVNLSGTGGSVANLTISDGATYNFGSVVKGYSLTKTFTISNVGNVAATSITGTALSAPFSYVGGSFPGTGGTCGTSLGASGTCTVLVRFSPTATGAASDTFTINYDDSSGATSSSRPISGSGSTISKISGGTSHTCALYSTGAVKCWGSGFFGQLGNSSNSDSTSPVSVGGISTATDLATGANHSCALLANGRIYCWGADNSGQLGDSAALTNQNAATQVASFTDFTSVSAGGDTTCGRRSGGTIVCWGYDADGAVGNNAAFLNQPTPVTVSGLTSMTDVSVGRSHACGRRSDNTFRCWGSDNFGQLGNGGANTNSGIPVIPVPGTATSASAGGDVSCSFLSGGTVKCWGADDVGQLGDSVALTSQISPVTVTDLANVTAIKLGLKHGCALNASNSVLCWGRDTSGQLGDDGSFTNQPLPVSVSGMTNATTIGVGENHSCAALDTGLVYCWGANSASQLGDGGTSDQPTPVLVQGL